MILSWMKQLPKTNISFRKNPRSLFYGENRDAAVVTDALIVNPDSEGLFNQVHVCNLYAEIGNQGPLSFICMVS